MLQINSETAHKMFYQLMERFDKIEKMLERQNKMKECNPSIPSIRFIALVIKTIKRTAKAPPNQIFKSRIPQKP